MKYFSILIILISLISCQNLSVAKDDVAHLQNLKQEANKNLEVATRATLNSKTLEDLQGLWIHKNDTTNQVLFTGNLKTDFFAGRNYESYFVLQDNGNDTIEIEIDETAQVKDDYILMIGPMKQSLHIKVLTESFLELEYVGTETIFSYKKIAGTYTGC